ncbi:vitamin K epoxide reductase family protein [Candidatus Woesearchaeota archaeon]|nr:vitamin K epoxide reductase family protein [Candidatus Woesearchaeota archaeon]
MKRNTHRRILQTIFILGLFGVLLASFLTITHYTGTPGVACPKKAHGMPTCDIVNQSIYAEIFGIPIALIAVFVYAAYSMMAYLLLIGKRLASLLSMRLYQGLVLISGASMLFALYLIYTLYAILRTTCVYCIVAHAITLAIFILSLVALFQARKAKVK